MNEEMIIWIVYGLVVLVLIASNWKIFNKANQEGWKSIIPIYGFLVFLKIIGKPWWFLFLTMIPIVSIVIYVWVLILLSKKFGQSNGFTVGLIFLPFIFLPILAFGSSKYIEGSLPISE